MPRRAKYTSEFKKDIKRVRSRGFKMELIDTVVDALIEGKTLPAIYKDHALVGDWEGCRDCHIKPNWLLIYRLSVIPESERNPGDPAEEVIFVRTGTHPDIF